MVTVGAGRVGLGTSGSGSHKGVVWVEHHLGAGALYSTSVSMTIEPLWRRIVSKSYCEALV